MKLATLLLAFAACAATPHPHTTPTTRDALLDASAGDFHAHTRVTAVRHVRFGHILGEAGRTHSIVCGEFRATGDWTKFATIATSDFEQWLGAGADQWCDRPQATWDDADLTSALQARLDRLR